MVIAIDWDHTLVDREEWRAGAKEAISSLREKGHEVWIHSCNSPRWIRSMLDNAGVVVDGIWDEPGKPVAHLYIDDRGFHYTDWTTDLPLILGRLND